MKLIRTSIRFITNTLMQELLQLLKNMLRLAFVCCLIIANRIYAQLPSIPEPDGIPVGPTGQQEVSGLPGGTDDTQPLTALIPSTEYHQWLHSTVPDLRIISHDAQLAISSNLGDAESCNSSHQYSHCDERLQCTSITCEPPSCPANPNPVPITDLILPLSEYLLVLPDSALCGILRTPEGLEFQLTPGAPVQCQDNLTLPSISVQSRDANVTLTFQLEVNEYPAGPLMRISRGLEHNYYLSVRQDSVIVIDALGVSSAISVFDRKLNFTIEVKDYPIATYSVMLIFVNEQQLPFFEMRNVDLNSNLVVRLGSSQAPGWMGRITNMQLYSDVLTQFEVITIQTGDPVNYLFRPDCTCPRDYLKVTLPIPELFYDYSMCYDDLLPTASLPRFSGSRFLTDIDVEYPAPPWISDFTNNMKLTISFPQQMQVYAMSLDMLTMPKHLIVYSLPSLAPIARITADCESDFGVTAASFPFSFQQLIPSRPSEPAPSRHKRNAEKVKCFNWQQLISEDAAPSISTTPAINEFGASLSPYTRYIIPFILHNEENDIHQPQFLADGIKLSFSGQQEADSFYSISYMEILGRPNCNGYPFSYTGLSSPLLPYSCQCDNGLSGNECGVPCDNENVWNKDGSGICIDCRCSDISTSQQCDQSGQCSCPSVAKLPVSKETGSHCFWHIDDIYPLYGPVAGGTIINAAGAYLNTPQVHTTDQDAGFNTLNSTVSNLSILSSSYPWENRSVWMSIVNLANATWNANLGYPVKQYQFRYLPNPILQGLSPRRSTLSGGILITVTGRFIDSVARPKMIIYIKYNYNGVLLPISQLQTDCRVIDGQSMTCPTPYLKTAYTRALHGEKPHPNRSVQANTTATLLEWTSPTTTPTTTTTTTTPTTRPAATTARTTTADVNNTGSTTESLPVRRRKAVNESIGDLPKTYLNGAQQLHFLVGFVFDGHDMYSDLSHPSLPPEIRDLAEVFLYDDPVIDDFHEENRIREKTQMLLFITGERMNWGCRQEDYHVEIGQEECNVTDLSSNQLVCQPPSDPPLADPKNSAQHRNKEIPHVKVLCGNYDTAPGFLYYKENPFEDPAFSAGIGVLIAIIVFTIMLAILVSIFCRRRSQRRKKLAAIELATGPSQKARCLDKFPAELTQNVLRCEIPASKIHTAAGRIGKGNFGTVYKGTLAMPSGATKTVAVKSLKDTVDISDEDVENFLLEATIMIDFCHENVLSLIGIVWEDHDSPRVVLPYMENGDVKTLLKREELNFSIGDLLHFSLQIANGMEYLESKKFVHRDLAARNIMSNGEYLLKVADFGLARDIYEMDYYKVQNENRGLPIKWMAVESMKTGKFSTETDVWSYGITIWEIFTRGSEPYNTVLNQNMKTHLSEGHRLIWPDFLPQHVCDTFSKCWEEDPTDRPSFSELSRSIIAFFQPQTTPNETEYKLFSLDRDYTKTIPEDYLTPQTTNDYLTPVRMNTYVKQSPAYDTAADYDTASTEDVDADGCILPSSSFTLAV